MFCSECGREIDPDQMYCRFCGCEIGELDGKTLWQKRVGTFAVGAFLGILVILLMTIITAILPINDRDTKFYIFFVVLSVILFGIASSLFFERRPTRKQKRSKKESSLESGQPFPQLPVSTIEPIPSVTENTTELLGLKKRGSKASDELL